MGAATCCRGGGGAVRRHRGRGEGCHLLRTATAVMVSRLSSAAMMGIPTFLKVSREVRDFLRGVTSVRGRGRACSQYSEATPAKAHSFPTLWPLVRSPGKLWGPFWLVLGLLLQTRLSFLSTGAPHLLSFTQACPSFTGAPLAHGAFSLS